MSSISPKLANRIIPRRTGHKIEPNLQPDQNSFRPHRSTTSFISVLRTIIGIKPNKGKTMLTVLDCDSIWSNAAHIMSIWHLAKLINSISLMHQNTRRWVLRLDGNTGFFEIVAEVLQGNTVATYLCVLYWTMPCGKQYKDEKRKIDSNLIRKEVDVII